MSFLFMEKIFFFFKFVWKLRRLDFVFVFYFLYRRFVFYVRFFILPSGFLLFFLFFICIDAFLHLGDFIHWDVISFSIFFNYIYPFFAAYEVFADRLISIFAVASCYFPFSIFIWIFISLESTFFFCIGVSGSLKKKKQKAIRWSMFLLHLWYLVAEMHLCSIVTIPPTHPPFFYKIFRVNHFDPALAFCNV